MNDVRKEGMKRNRERDGQLRLEKPEFFTQLPDLNYWIIGMMRDGQGNRKEAWVIPKKKKKTEREGKVNRGLAHKPQSNIFLFWY